MQPSPFHFPRNQLLRKHNSTWMSHIKATNRTFTTTMFKHAQLRPTVPLKIWSPRHPPIPPSNSRHQLHQLMVLLKTSKSDTSNPSTTPPKFNNEFTPEKRWLEDFLLSYWVSVTFQGLFLLNFGGGNLSKVPILLSRMQLGFQLQRWNLLLRHFGLLFAWKKKVWKGSLNVNSRDWVWFMLIHL